MRWVHLLKFFLLQTALTFALPHVTSFFFNRVNFFFDINVLPVRGRPGRRILGLLYCFRCRKSEHILATTGGGTIIMSIYLCVCSVKSRDGERMCAFSFIHAYFWYVSCLVFLSSSSVDIEKSTFLLFYYVTWKILETIYHYYYFDYHYNFILTLCGGEAKQCTDVVV